MTAFHAAILIHYWGAFGIVLCLGVIQILVIYYGSVLTIEALPAHVSDARRQRHKTVYAILLVVFVLLTFALAKFNDSTQYEATLINQAGQAKQDALRLQLLDTAQVVQRAEKELTVIRQAVAAHPRGEEREQMLKSLTDVQSSLHQQTMSMQAVQKH